MNGIILRRTIACCLILGTAGGAVYAELQKGRYESGNLGTIQQNSLPRFSVDANYEAGAYALVPPALPPGEGQVETTGYCSVCHSTRYITMQPPLTAATWEDEVNKMIRAYGAPVPEASAKKIIFYLQHNFTPETRKQ